MTTYGDAMTMREARDAYFAANGFGADGGYGDAWVDFKLGPVPFPFPNTPQRVDAVKYHDLHHVLTGYATSFTGELEISGWELGAGCKDKIAAWVLNLGGVAAGVFVAPRRTFRAFARGRRSQTLYGERYEALLDATVGDARRTHVAAQDTPASASDVVLFGATVIAGVLTGLVTFAVALPLAPLGVLFGWLKKRAS